MKRGAALYHRRDYWLVGPLTQVHGGPFVSVDPFLKLPDTISFGHLAEELRTALSRSRTMPYINLRDTPLPPSPILQAAGVKSESTFRRGARHVGVLADGESIILSPSENKGGRGFWFLDSIHVPDTAASAALGEAIEQAFAACR